MKSVSLCSLRGGAGATSLAAMLADTLNRMGESVALVDLNEADLLRLHFGVSYDDPHGWAAALAQGKAWHEQAFQIREGLMLLPYGRHGAGAMEAASVPAGDEFWIRARMQMASYSWVIFDLPSGLKHYAGLRRACDIDLVVAQPDMASHVLLMQARLSAASRIVINRLDPAQALATDIVLDWRRHFAAQLAPLQIDYDENIHEALACQSPVASRAPGSSGARDAQTLATWCKARMG